MNEIQIFNHEEFGEIRTIEIEGQIYFVGVDVAKALGYTKPRNAIRDHIDEEDKNLTKITYINIYKNNVLTEEDYNILKDNEKEFKYRKCVEYNKDAVREAKKNIYYLNSKVVYFKNNIDNNHYKKYFKNVIMKYLMQVIPSTTILILQGFEENE